MSGVLINLSALLDDAKCFELVRQTRGGFRAKGPRPIEHNISPSLSRRAITCAFDAACPRSRSKIRLSVWRRFL